MSLQKTLKRRKLRRTFRVRNRLTSTADRPRISVFKSLKYIYAQVIDDTTSSTIMSFSSSNLIGFKGDKTAAAKQVGVELGKLATSKSIKKIVFDRGGYLYHGRIRALAEGLRDGGLQF